MDEDAVKSIVMNVHKGYRTKKELKRCGCEDCDEALKRLRGSVVS